MGTPEPKREGLTVAENYVVEALTEHADIVQFARELQAHMWGTVTEKRLAAALVAVDEAARAQFTEDR